MSGYCSIGDTDIDTAPASTTSSEMTDERIGRSMKKWVNTGPRLLLRRLVALFGLARCGRARLADLDRLAGDDLQHALDHDAVAGPQAIRDQDVLLVGVVTDHDGPQLRGAVFLDDVYEVPLRALLHRELGHDHGVRARAALDVRGDEHAGPQVLLRIRDHCAHLERAGLLAEGRIGEVDPARERIRLSVGHDDLDLVVLVLGHGQLPFLHQLAHLRDLVLGDAEVHPHRIDSGDVRELRRLADRVDVRALALLRPAGKPGHRRAYRRVAEVELGLFQFRLRREHRGAG